MQLGYVCLENYFYGEISYLYLLWWNIISNYIYGEKEKAKQQTRLLPQPEISEEKDLYSNSENEL